jgi:hypothetical protein
MCGRLRERKERASARERRGCSFTVIAQTSSTREGRRREAGKEEGREVESEKVKERAQRERGNSRERESERENTKKGDQEGLNWTRWRRRTVVEPAKDSVGEPLREPLERLYAVVFSNSHQSSPMTSLLTSHLRACEHRCIYEGFYLCEFVTLAN